jgi:hypothetical protein
VDSRALGGPARDAALAGGGANPVLDSAGEPPRGDRGRCERAGRPDGGTATYIRSTCRGPCLSTRLPPCGHDGTARRIARPQDPVEQTRGDRGKNKCHTVKHVRLINAALTRLFLSETYAGSTHDKRMADATPYPLPAGRRLLQDLGFLAFTLDRVDLIMPTRKPRGRPLTRAQNTAHRRIARRRVRIEPVTSRVKRCRIVHATCRLRKAGIRDLLMEVCCAWQNFRVRLTPWQALV